MVFKLLHYTLSALILTISIATSSHASTVDWSTVTLSGTFPNYSFSDATLGLVSIDYSNDTEFFGVQTPFGGVETLLLGNTGGESLTISWSNNVVNLEMPIWDIDALPATSGESVTFVTTASVSPVSLHSTDIWNATTLTLSSDGTANPNTDLGNFTVMSFVDPVGFNSVTLNWSVSGTGITGIGNLTVQAVPTPAAVWLFGSGLLGLVAVARRKKA